jgi:hypothetical protein
MSRKRGRPRKNGRREPNGRLARAEPSIIRGNERAQARLALYGQDGIDAIGRAYTRGLLGSEAKQLLDTARAIARAYWAWYEIGPYACPLGNRTGSSIHRDEEREQRQEEWLRSQLAIRDRFGFDKRRLFDQLVINVNPDEGPAWLDRLIDRKGYSNDWSRLSAALEVLCECAGVPLKSSAAA